MRLVVGRFDQQLFDIGRGRIPFPAKINLSAFGIVSQADDGNVVPHGIIQDHALAAAILRHKADTGGNGLLGVLEAHCFSV